MKGIFDMGEKKAFIIYGVVFVFVAGALCLMVGCGDRFWDPTQIGRFRPVPAVNVILDSLGVAEETPSEFEGAEEPRPIDVMAYEQDYTLNAGDIVQISIFELQAEGIMFANNFVVTESGNISIPEVGIIEAEGLTEPQLEERIRQILSPSILKNPSVTASLVASQRRTFSIWGNAVPVPGRYQIPRYDFRLTDALATARVATQFNVSYIYVSRPITGRDRLDQDEQPQQDIPMPYVPQENMLEIIAPRAQQASAYMITANEMAMDDELHTAAMPDGFSRNESDQGIQDSDERDPRQAKTIHDVQIAQPIEPSDDSRVEWVFRDGKWIPQKVGDSQPARSTQPSIPENGYEGINGPLQEKLPSDFDWGDLGTSTIEHRLIEIPTDQLASGDPRYNIVIRPGDSVHVPVDIIGEFYIYGNVNRVGAIELTGRPMTLKMAVAAAGGLGPLAYPKRCEVIRRIGKKREEIIMVDLDKIARGEQPDFFIKPNDLINIGTHATSRWRAVLRNAFRATYGFGFIYDRNFADRDFGTRRPLPNWF